MAGKHQNLGLDQPSPATVLAMSDTFNIGVKPLVSLRMA
jgi:hypothetical protein